MKAKPILAILGRSFRSDVVLGWCTMGDDNFNEYVSMPSVNVLALTSNQPHTPLIPFSIYFLL